jgi:N-acetylglucosaminyl-diphospho-decaprenol L-rhamnosyltransferase
MPDISVVIVTWNGRPHLEVCLTALLGQQGVDAETIVVDNASTDGTAEVVRARFPWVRLLVLPENRGFAGGNNAGVREAGGQYVAFLNDDTSVDRGWLSALRKGIDEPNRIVLATSRVVYMHDPEIVDSAGDGLTRAGGAFKRHHGGRAGEVGESTEVFGACGAAFLMPRAIFDEIGGFDEDFFASHEDVDLSYRARLRGYRVRYVADAVVRHHGSKTLGRVSASAVFHSQRNLEWVYVKNTPARLLLRTLPGHLLYDIAAAAHFTRHGLLGTFVRAKAAAVAGLPAMLRKRALIQRSRVVGSAEIWRHLEPRWLALKLREERFDVRLAQGVR